MSRGVARVLEALAREVPSRVRWAAEADVWEIWADYGPHQGMTYTRHSIHPDEVVPPLTLAALRLTLEQECEARGWAWTVAKGEPGDYQAVVRVPSSAGYWRLSNASTHSAVASSPAEAVAEALKAACLEARA